VNREHIHYLRTTIEAYDGMAVVRTVEPPGHDGSAAPSQQRLNPPKPASSQAEGAEETRISTRLGNRESSRRRVEPNEAVIELLIAPGCEDLISRLIASLKEQEGIPLERITA
jgi:hypothetical protein